MHEIRGPRLDDEPWEEIPEKHGSKFQSRTRLAWTLVSEFLIIDQLVT